MCTPPRRGTYAAAPNSSRRGPAAGDESMHEKTPRRNRKESPWTTRVWDAVARPQARAALARAKQWGESGLGTRWRSLGR